MFRSSFALSGAKNYKSVIARVDLGQLGEFRICILVRHHQASPAVGQPATARFPSWRPRRSASHRRRGAVFSHAELHRRLPTPRISADATITAATPAKARRGVRDRYRTAPLGFDWECYDDATPTTAT
jgi:hypothetical protein